MNRFVCVYARACVRVYITCVKKELCSKHIMEMVLSFLMTRINFCSVSKNMEDLIELRIFFNWEKFSKSLEIGRHMYISKKDILFHRELQITWNTETLIERNYILIICNNCISFPNVIKLQQLKLIANNF